MSSFFVQSSSLISHIATSKLSQDLENLGLICTFRGSDPKNKCRLPKEGIFVAHCHAPSKKLLKSYPELV